MGTDVRHDFVSDFASPHIKYRNNVLGSRIDGLYVDPLTVPSEWRESECMDVQRCTIHDAS